jgi:hypothetical protein
MLQAVGSPTIIILTTLEVSFMLLDDIYSTGIPYDHHLSLSKYFYSTRPQEPTFKVVLGKQYMWKMEIKIVSNFSFTIDKARSLS